MICDTGGDDNLYFIILIVVKKHIKYFDLKVPKFSNLNALSKIVLIYQPYAALVLPNEHFKITLGLFYYMIIMTKIMEIIVLSLPNLIKKL